MLLIGGYMQAMQAGDVTTSDAVRRRITAL
jgi:hypothetical protein